MKRPKELLLAEALRQVINSHEYQQTVGAWIEEARKKALYDLENATEIHDVHRAQGAYRALADITDLFDATFARGQKASEALQKKLTN